MTQDRIASLIQAARQFSEELARIAEAAEAEPSPTLDRPMNQVEAADYLGISTRQLSRLMRDPQRPVPFSRFGDRVYRFRRSALDAWMAEGERIHLAETTTARKELSARLKTLSGGKR